MNGILKNESTGSPGNNNYKICLISLYSSSNICLRYLASALQRPSFDVSVIFFKEKNIALDLMEEPTERDYETLMDLISELNPNLIGIGVRSSFLAIASRGGI